MLIYVHLFISLSNFIQKCKIEKKRTMYINIYGVKICQNILKKINKKEFFLLYLYYLFIITQSFHPGKN